MTMTNYAKLMKIYNDNAYDVISVEIDDLSKFGSYPEIMKKIYEQGYTQITINSYLMLKILEKVNGSRDWEIINMEITDPTIDEETINEIKLIFNQIKNKEKDFTLMKDYLFWALDDGSIFIDKIILYNTEANVSEEVYSNGLIFGQNNELIFLDIIKEIMNGYLNE
ncbi:hypothetical protein [Staphylococcus xylosus]|uniref:hypothetical protein n=1 Tax=Staphylococcus xylosus TaxID=1288 RepID=UPI000C08B819|nr:hypothetical protein [Staphylococcus xylosus]MCR1813645.1 hypothetical protein [Staphylococcus xylosus]PHS80860.1 hypothetical protein BTM19_08185 [Staphylococcus xylosus]PNZ14656.1 hypothetical protein CD106_08410 [Staphylococcus xylosus]SUM98954.1 Uncharacterised protein [Staphylococcus xylosus]GEQ11572.1 hypothetical protein SXY01_21160 [Staphylococcus xylosus]